MSEVREDAEKKAARLGLLLVKPMSSEVFVDIDSWQDRGQFEERYALALKLWPKMTMRIIPSISNRPGRFHAYVTIPELDPIGGHERIALQAALGSDAFREFLAIFHGRAGYAHTSVFFENKEKKEAEGAEKGDDSTGERVNADIPAIALLTPDSRSDKI